MDGAYRTVSAIHGNREMIRGKKRQHRLTTRVVLRLAIFYPFNVGRSLPSLETTTEILRFYSYFNHARIMAESDKGEVEKSNGSSNRRIANGQANGNRGS